MIKKLLMVAFMAMFSLLSISRAEAHERWSWWLPPLPPVPAVVVAPAPVYEPATVYAPAPSYGYYYDNDRPYRAGYERGWREGMRRRQVQYGPRYYYGYQDHDRWGHRRGYDDDRDCRGRHDHDYDD